MFARVDPVAEHTHGRIQPLGHASDLRDRGVRFQLAVLPDQHLLVVPPQPDADLRHRREAVGIFGKQVLTHGLCAMDDLRVTRRRNPPLR